jgi:hypothetical protein
MQTRDIEQDLVDYIMGLWDQQHRFKLILQNPKPGRFEMKRNADGGVYLENKESAQ